MNKRLVIVLCAILTAALLVGCSAAPAAAPTEAPSAAPSAAERPTADAAAAPESAQRTVWQPQFIPLASKDFLSGLQSGARQGESLYFISSGVIDDRTPEGVTPEWPEQYWVYGPILVKVATDGASEIVPYTPVLPGSGSSLRKTASGSWRTRMRSGKRTKKAGRSGRSSTSQRTEAFWRVSRLQPSR